MRKCYALLLVILLLFLYGCSEKPDYITPVQVYYTSSQVDFHSTYGIISTETIEYEGWENKTRDFLNQYLSGPHSQDLTSPFPTGAWILDMTQEESIINIQLNTHFSRLSPNEYTLACTCLSLTIFDLLHAEVVNIQISGSDQILSMNRDNLIFSENNEYK